MANEITFTTTVKLPVEQLDVGMYVARLDRPWLETPFLFQGFYIREEDEIRELRQYCEHVYVSSETAVLAKTAAPREGRKESSKRPEVRAVPAKESGFQRDRSITVYEETVPLKEEVSTASRIHKSAVDTVRNVMSNLRDTGRLDVSVMRSTLTPMVDSVLRNPAALACLIRMRKKGDYLYQHSLACAVWAAILGRQLGLARGDLDIVALGATLIDVGMVRVPDHILAKSGKLTGAEEALVRQHVQHGVDIIKEAGAVDPRVIDMVAHHHERANGTGYPRGRKGNAIPVFGRIAGIVDAYDAMITPRPYAAALSSYDAIRKLQVLADVEFQAEMVDQFTRAIGAFPTGTMVELNTGEIAIVVKQNEVSRLRPEVMVVADKDGDPLEDFRVLDLSQETVDKAGGDSLWIERGLPPDACAIDPADFFLV